jgi:hypothetical protein
MSDEPKTLKKDEKKPRISLIPYAAIEEEAYVMGYGATKHAPHGWRRVADADPELAKHSELYDAMLRHAHQAADGIDNDAESLLLHLAHVRCNAGFLIEFIKRGAGTDDRYRAGVDSGDARRQQAILEAFEKENTRLEKENADLRAQISGAVVRGAIVAADPCGRLYGDEDDGAADLPCVLPKRHDGDHIDRHGNGWCDDECA